MNYFLTFYLSVLYEIFNLKNYNNSLKIHSVKFFVEFYLVNLMINYMAFV
jgi:hypothetical protein